MANIQQKKVQPYQIDQAKLDVGKVRSYTPSNENAPMTIPVRNEDTETSLYKVKVDKYLEGDIYGTIRGALIPKTDENGNYISEDNRTINAEGRLVNKNGQLVDLDGKRIDSNGYLLDDIGNSTTTKGNIDINERIKPILVPDNNQIVAEGKLKGTLEGTVTGKIIGDLEEGNINANAIKANSIDVRTNDVSSNKGVVYANSFIGKHEGTGVGEYSGIFSGTIVESTFASGTIKGDIEATNINSDVINAISALNVGEKGSLVSPKINTQELVSNTISAELIEGNTRGKHTGEVEGNVIGNSDTATKLFKKVSIILDGAIQSVKNVNNRLELAPYDFDGSETEPLRIQTRLSSTSTSTYDNIRATQSYRFDDNTTLIYVADTDTEARNPYTMAKISTSTELDKNGNLVDVTYLDLAEDVRQNGRILYSKNGPVISVADGGTGVNIREYEASTESRFEGLVKANGDAPFSIAQPGIDYITNVSVGTLTNKTIDLSNATNNLLNIRVNNFDPEIVVKDFSSGVDDSKIPTAKAVKDLIESTYTGLSWKNAARCATTENRDINTGFIAGNTIDGVELKPNDRILIKDQTNKIENGVYIVNSRGKPVRAIDSDTADKLASSAIYINEGDINANTGWVCDSNINTLGEDPINYFQFAGTNLYVQGEGIVIDSNVIKVANDVILAEKSQVIRNKEVHGNFIGNLTGNVTGVASKAKDADIATTSINVKGTGTVEASTGTFTGTVSWQGGDSIAANEAIANSLCWNGKADKLNLDDAKVSLNLGNMASQNKNNVDITGGNITGISPLNQAYGGTGKDITSINGILKNTSDGITGAIPAEDYLTADSINTLTNKSIDANNNTISNIDLHNFKNGVISTNTSLSENTDDLIPTQRAIKTYIDERSSGAAWKTPVRCASTTNISIIHELLPGTVIDGIVLNEGDRVLLKDQNLPSENGIYVVSSTLSTRAEDFNSATEFNAAAIMVLEGVALGGTSWICITKDSDITLESTPIEWKIYGTKRFQVGDGLKYNDNTIIVPDYNEIVSVNKTQKLSNKTLDSRTTVISNGAATDGNIVFDLLNSGTLTVRAYGAGNKTYILPDNGGKIYAQGSQVIPVTEGGTGKSTIAPNKILIGGEGNTFTEFLIDDSAKQFLSNGDITTYLDSASARGKIRDIIGPTQTEALSDYIKKDGSVSFEGTIKGVSPIESNDLATKQYVDDLVLGGLRFRCVVESCITNYTSVPLGDGYFNTYWVVPSEAQSGPWSGHENEIAKRLENSWEFLSDLETGDFVYVRGNTALQSAENYRPIEEAGQKIWNGTEWEYSGASQLVTHDDLLNIKGGQWHLTKAEHDSLTKLTDPCNIHKHSHAALANMQGGSPNNYWHLTSSQHTGLVAGGPTILHTHDHSILTNTQGGKAGEKYHLSAAAYNELTAGTVTNIHTHNHGDLANRLGGDYHLTTTEHKALVENGLVPSSMHKHDHNASVNIQGGDGVNNYHLGQAQYFDLTNGQSTNIHKHNHDDMVGIAGGRSGQYYHIDKEIYEKLVANKIGITDHNDLENLKGGNDNEYYHLPEDKYNQLISFNGTIGNHNTLNNLQGGKTNEYYHINAAEAEFVSTHTLEGIYHSELKGVSGGNYHLTEEQYNSLVSGNSTNLHAHNIYIKTDGTNAFTNTVSGVFPTDKSHLATKEYVDSVAEGLKWIAPILSMDILDPSTLNYEGRYIVPQNAIGDWADKYGNIAVGKDNSWIFEEVQNKTTVYDNNTKSVYTWNGTEWCKIDSCTELHEDLGNILGGDWHLTEEQHNGLVNNTTTNLHYHEADRDLANATGVLNAARGGTGLSTIPTNSILYSTEENVLLPTRISELGRSIISANNPTELRMVLPYKSLALQDANSVNITGGSINGITPLDVTSGGTGTNTLTGIVKGNGTNRFTPAVDGVDYISPDGNGALYNKTIDASSNIITNIGLESFKATILSTIIPLSNASNNKIPTEKAIKDYVDTYTTGLEGGKHEFIGSAHSFNGAIANSLLVFTGDNNNPTKYKTLESSDLLSIVNNTDTIRFVINNSVVTTNKEQALENKTLINPIISSDQWANAKHNHTNDESGGKIPTEAISGVLPVNKGGTGISEISKNSIIYANADNHFGELKLGTFALNHLSANTYAEFNDIVNNIIPNVKEIQLTNPNDEVEFTPNITSDKDLDINAAEELRLVSDDISIGKSMNESIININAKNYTLHSLNNVKVSALNYEIDFSLYNATNEKGLYIKDSITTEVQPTSTLTLGGTLAIVPTTVLFSAENRSIAQETTIDKHSSVILLNADSTLARDYSDEDLEFVLESPASVIGQTLFIKIITDCNITIRAKNGEHIDGEDSITLTRKYMSVTLYSSGSEWFII